MDYRIRTSDYLWLVVTALGIAAAGSTIVPVFLNLLRDPSIGRLLAFLVGTFLVVGVSRWVVMGAWRRTAWGAPPGGVREVRERRRPT